MSLFSLMLEAIPTRFSTGVYLYNVTGPLLLSGQVSEKKVRICIIPNAFENVKIFNAHSTCPCKAP